MSKPGMFQSWGQAWRLLLLAGSIYLLIAAVFLAWAWPWIVLALLVFALAIA